MALEKEQSPSSQRVSTEEKRGESAKEDGDGKPNEAKGGLGAYFVSMFVERIEAAY
jgi:hypothetical protein